MSKRSNLISRNKKNKKIWNHVTDLLRPPCSVESVSAPSQSLRTQWTCPVATSSAEPAGKGTRMNIQCVSVCVFYWSRCVLAQFYVCVFLRFLNVKIQEGDAHNIFCPAYECYQLVPVHVIESVVSREMDRRYLQFDIKVEVKIIVCTFSSRLGLCSVSCCTI